MRRWAMAAMIVLVGATLAGSLLTAPNHTKALEGSTRMTAMGLILLEDDAGLYVLGVTDGGLADNAGIHPGDYLTSAKGTTLTTTAQLEELLNGQDGRDDIPVTLFRQEQSLTVNLSLR